MKVVIINGFETFNERMNLISDYYQKNNIEVIKVSSNYSHMKKEFLEKLDESSIYIETKPYYKNLSFSRIRSHYHFAKKSVLKALKYDPDIIHIIIPSNSLVYFASKYKKKNRVKIIFDIMDLWPESLPIKGVKYLPPIMKWKNLRDSNLKYADFIITECNLFKNHIIKNLNKRKINTDNIDTIYLAKHDLKLERKVDLSNEVIEIAYLGSINNIIDIPKIISLMTILNKQSPVKFHIIGDGENRKELIDKVQAIGVKVIYYGKVYDPTIKQSIFDKCHYGLNIMKDSVHVGLTMKSVDYFQHGLPIINNIPHDTKMMVEEYNIGINIENLNLLNNFKRLSLEHRLNIDELFAKNFSSKSYNNKMDKVMEYLEIKHFLNL